MQQPIEIISIGAICMFIIREVFSYIKTRKNGGGEQFREIAVLKEKLERIETNELKHIDAKLDLNSSDHLKIFVMLARMEESINYIKNNIKS